MHNKGFGRGVKLAFKKDGTVEKRQQRNMVKSTVASMKCVKRPNLCAMKRMAVSAKGSHSLLHLSLFPTDPPAFLILKLVV
jgi:hypothetical protein